jgi:hypothetical protein
MEAALGFIEELRRAAKPALQALTAQRKADKSLLVGVLID